MSVTELTHKALQMKNWQALYLLRKETLRKLVEQSKNESPKNSR